jgi:hypothetical protein
MVRKIGETNYLKAGYERMKLAAKSFLPQTSKRTLAFEAGIISGKPQITLVHADVPVFGGGAGGTKKSSGKSISLELKELLEMPHEDIAWEYYYDHFEKHPDVTKQLEASGWENPFALSDKGLVSYAKRKNKPGANEYFKFFAALSKIMGRTFAAMRGLSGDSTEGKFQEIKHCYMLAALFRAMGIRSGVIFKEYPKNMLKPYEPFLNTIKISAWARLNGELYEVNFRQVTPLDLYIGTVLRVFGIDFLPKLTHYETKYNTIRQSFAFYSLAKGYSLDENKRQEEAESEFVRACEIDPSSNDHRFKLELFVGDIFHNNSLDTSKTFERFYRGQMNDYEKTTFAKLLEEHKGVQYLFEFYKDYYK